MSVGQTHVVATDDLPTTVEVVAYDPAWPEVFEAMRAELRAAVPEATAIEHVGSTSVPGLSSKPTIDVLLVLDGFDATDATALRLAMLRFEHRAAAFAPERRHLFFRKVRTDGLSVHLHVLPPDSPEPAEYLLFRDFLRATPAVAARYGHDKLDLAHRFANDRASYVVRKEPIVEALLTEARAWQSHGGQAGTVR